MTFYFTEKRILNGVWKEISMSVIYRSPEI